MRGPLNVNAQLTEDGHSVVLQAGIRNSHVAMNVVLDMDQAQFLYDLLGHALASEHSEQEYQDWLAKHTEAFAQVDQGGEVIPMHTLEDDLA